MTDVFIGPAIRTPIGRYGGSLSSVRADDLAAIAIAALLEKYSGLDPAQINEVVLGCANQAGEDNRNVARMASLLAGIPESVPAITVNRLCASGLDAVGYGARSVRSGEADILIAGGVESMSRAPFVQGKAEGAFARTAMLEDTTIGWRFVNPRFDETFGTDTMPQTAEHVAQAYGISRADQDAFAFRSQERALLAQASGRLAAEIIPVATARAKEAQSVCVADEHPRSTSIAKLASLNPITGPGGSVTPGNASGVNDGAAAMFIMSSLGVQRSGLAPRAKVLGFAAVGVEPRMMGIGPLPAIRKLLAQLALSVSDFDVIEINEAFAAQVLAVTRSLGLDDDADHVNPNGGAIALGHPLGMSGARLVLSAIEEMHQRGLRRALCAMCVGVGQGVAIALESAVPPR